MPREQLEPVASGPVEAITLVTEAATDLMVRASKGVDGPLRFGGVSEAVMDSAECAVLVVEETCSGRAASLDARAVPTLGAVAGSCATAARESSQGRKAAALSGYGRVP